MAHLLPTRPRASILAKRSQDHSRLRFTALLPPQVAQGLKARLDHLPALLSGKAAESLYHGLLPPYPEALSRLSRPQKLHPEEPGPLLPGLPCPVQALPSRHAFILAPEDGVLLIRESLVSRRVG